MRRKNKMTYLFLIFIVFSFISIGYAVLNKKLEIKGNSKILQNTWNLHFENVQVSEGSVDKENTVIINDSKDSVDFSASLNLPGDFYEFTVDVVNSGSIDAMIDSITKTPELTESQKKYLNYIIEYENGEQVANKQIVSKMSCVRLKVRIEYRTDLNADDLPMTTETLNLSFTINYIQSDSSGTKVLDNGYIKRFNVVNFVTNYVGSEICVDTECFYVMDFNNDTVTLLSKYNLMVGNMVDENRNILPLTSPTGIQDSKAIGVEFLASAVVGLPWYGINSFANINYWYDTNSKFFKSDFPVDFHANVDGVDFYAANVYSNESSLYQPMENYKMYLEKLGINVDRVRMINVSDFLKFNCSASGIEIDCTTAPEWLYSTAYWTGFGSVFESGFEVLDKASGINIFAVTPNGKVSMAAFNDQEWFGIRPVLEIPLSEFGAFL